MAHIPDGVLTTPVLVVGAAVSATLLAVALRRLDYPHLPQAAVLSAAFFVASLISVPLGPASVHLLLNGLMGLLLGWTAVPALVVALGLQAAFFGFGGVLVLGVNAMNLALPALACALLLRPRLLRPAGRQPFRIGIVAGALGVLLTAGLMALCLAASGEAFVPAARILLFAYVPLAVVEALITGTVVAFVQKVDPGLLRGSELQRE